MCQSTTEIIICARTYTAQDGLHVHWSTNNIKCFAAARMTAHHTRHLAFLFSFVVVVLKPFTAACVFIGLANGWSNNIIIIMMFYSQLLAYYELVEMFMAVLKHMSVFARATAYHNKKWWYRAETERYTANQIKTRSFACPANYNSMISFNMIFYFVRSLNAKLYLTIHLLVI